MAGGQITALLPREGAHVQTLGSPFRRQGGIHEVLPDLPPGFHVLGACFDHIQFAAFPRDQTRVVDLPGSQDQVNVNVARIAVVAGSVDGPANRHAVPLAQGGRVESDQDDLGGQGQLARQRDDHRASDLRVSATLG